MTANWCYYSVSFATKSYPTDNSSIMPISSVLRLLLNASTTHNAKQASKGKGSRTICKMNAHTSLLTVVKNVGSRYLEGNLLIITVHESLKLFTRGYSRKIKI